MGRRKRAMKSWKVLFSALAMALLLESSGYGLVTRWDFDMGGLTQDEAMTALGLQGLMNRNGPYLYYLISNHPQFYGTHYSHLWTPADAEWRSWYMSPPRSYSFTRINTFAGLLDLYKGQINSNLAVYDPQVKGEEAVAATYAGVYTCLPVSGAVLNRITPGSKEMVGWVEDHFASTEAWRIMKCKYIPTYPKADTSLVPPGGDGEAGFSGIQLGDDVLRMWGNTQTTWVAAWLYGATVDVNKYTKVKIRVDSLSSGTGVAVKLITIKNNLTKVYTYSPAVTDTGIKTLSIDSIPGTIEEPYYFEINAFGAGIDKKVRIDWVYSADGSGARAKRNHVNEEFSDLFNWTATNLTSAVIYRRNNLSHALKMTKASGDSGWITQPSDTVDLDLFPKIQIKVDSLSTSGVRWKLTAKNGNSTWVLKDWNTDTLAGLYTYNLKAITGLANKKTFEFRIKMRRTSGTKVMVVNWLRSLTVPLTESGWTKVKDLRTVAEQKKFPMQQWARDSLLSYTTSSHKALSGNNGLNTYVGVDYLVQDTGYVFRLDNEKETPNNEKALMGQILDGLYTGHEPVGVYGYLEREDTVNNENKYFQFLTEHGSYAMVTPAPNLSFHSQVPATHPLQRHLDTLTLDTTKYYVALMLSEGDTPKFAFSFFGGSWKRDPAKGTIPFNWGINPAFAEVCPSILEYYYSTNQSDSNFFFAGCSGVGATLPWYFPSSKLIDYANLFERVGGEADISISDIWQADQYYRDPPPYPPPYTNTNITTYATEDTNVKGFTVMQDQRLGQIPYGNVCFVSRGVPVVRVYKNFHYWVTYFDSSVYKQGWTNNRTRDDTLNRCPADQEVAWDSIGTGDKAAKWQAVVGTRLWEEYLRRNGERPFFTAVFSAPKPDSQVVTFAKGVRDSAAALAERKGKPGLFKFVTLEQMMDLAKKARKLGTVQISHNAKFSNSLACTLSLWSWENVADSMKIWDGTNATGWIPYASTYIWSFPGEGVQWSHVRYKIGHDSTSVFSDSIIVDTHAPYKGITSPPDGQQVGPNAPVEFWGYSYDYENHDSLWEIWENAFAWADSNSKVGNAWFWVPGYFGTWSSSILGQHTHTLVTRDSATNFDTVSVRVNVVDVGGDGDGFASSFGTSTSTPMNVATDASGSVYFAETQGNRIKKHSPNRDSLFVFSTRRNNDTSGTTWPAAMSLKDSTLLWIADGLNDCIKKFDRQGNLLLRFGSHGSDSGHFNQPCGVALDWKGRIWITDRLNHRIQVFDTTGTFLFGFGGQGQDSGKLNSPTGIAITQNKRVWVSDTKNNQVQVFDSLGNWVKTFKQPDTLGFDTPTGICTDKHGDIFIADTKHQRIVELNPFGRRLFIFGSLGDSLCQFRNPIGVASSPGGHYLYVADMGNRRVQRFTVIRGDTLGGGGPQGKETLRLPPKVNFMSQSYPNPTTGEAVIEYGLAKESPVTLTIYNVAGQVVREYNQGKQKAWYYSITWDGRSNRGHKVGAGIYFYRLEAGSWVKTRKMIVIR
jgi:sugar lactone lactonase YvrE